MTVSYVLGEALYLNITNRCSNACSFCVRTNQDGISQGLNLWLEREPSAREVLADIAGRDLSGMKEFVFCGYGEPTERIDTLTEICHGLKREYSLPIRLNTNGQGSLIHGRNIASELAGLIDSVSISLNASNAERYQEICGSRYGEGAFGAMLDFASACKGIIPSVCLSIVDVLPAEEIDRCKALAASLNIPLRIRHLIGEGPSRNEPV